MSLVSKVGAAFRASYIELTQKVTWPTRQELTNSAVVVMIASIIIALFVLLVDLFFDNLIMSIYRLLS